jgi:SUKH-4 immunity protein
MIAISPADLKAAWTAAGDVLLPYSEAAVAAAPIPDDAKRFLIDVGLPDQAAPFLIFSASRALRSADVEYGLDKSAGEHVIIGSTGSGDPIVIARNGRVSWLDHDTHFVERYINENVSLLAATLLHYRELAAMTDHILGSDVGLDGRASLSAKRAFESFLQQYDPAALSAGAFWADELADLSND